MAVKVWGVSILKVLNDIRSHEIERRVTYTIGIIAFRNDVRDVPFCVLQKTPLFVSKLSF